MSEIEMVGQVCMA